MKNYLKLKHELLNGWNTWNTRSVLSHVLLPEGLAINLGVKEYATGDYLGETLPGRVAGEACPQRRDNSPEMVTPKEHAYDGSYTALKMSWRGIVLEIESAVVDNDIFLLIHTLENQNVPATLIAEIGYLWNHNGLTHPLQDGQIVAQSAATEITIRTTAETVTELNVPCNSPYLAVSLDNNVSIYSGHERSLADIENLISQQRNLYLSNSETFGEQAELHRAVQSCLAWHVIYDPSKDRPLSQVGRTWSVEWGGWVQHCWDMYLLGEMHAVLGNKELAYCAVTEISSEIKRYGFVPNCVAANGFSTLDRSQPPVGAFIVNRLYRRYKDKWFINGLFDDLMQWNQWYMIKRSVGDGILAWGSRTYSPQLGNYWESAGVGEFYGAAMESGMDNSHMYDDIVMDSETHNMRLADVGLTSLLLADTEALLDMAAALDRKEDFEKLDGQISILSKGLQSLWDEERGLFYNLHTDSRKFSRRISPTNFYPLLTGAVSTHQADRMVSEHLLNEDEFWGKWVIPSTPRNEPAFSEQNYWRGRIWPPTNYLVYLGLDRYHFDDIKKELADKSAQLFLQEWESEGHSHENYNAITGAGCDVTNSESYFSWGGLLALPLLSQKQGEE